jgi:dihydroxyacetone kinase-like protein
VSGALIVDWLRLAASRISAERAYLTGLDAAIGDGDHGINMDRGFGVLGGRLASAAGEAAMGAPGPVLALAGRTITGTVGGASGALYGRALVRAATAVEAWPAGSVATLALVAAAVRAAVDGVAALGRSKPGEKTMLDALVPAAHALEAAAAAGVDIVTALARAADAAEAGARDTVGLLATRGRASYLGERSIGHLDPGAVSSALLVRALADVAARGA